MPPGMTNIGVGLLEGFALTIEFCVNNLNFTDFSNSVPVIQILFDKNELVFIHLFIIFLRFLMYVRY